MDFLTSLRVAPAHKTLIDQYLDWERVHQRLARYSHICRHYPVNFLQGCSNSRPYYCHYFAWRLGTWESENLFEFFDDLLAYGASLRNWDSNTNLLTSCSFDDFWGLIWQLQIAKLFSGKNGVQVEWMNSGPDLKVDFGDKSFFIECYTYRKSFRIEEFIGELLKQVNQNIRVSHVLCTQFSLPDDASSLEVFLDELFAPYLDTAFLDEKIKQAQVEYPVLLPKPDCVDNLYVYLEGNDPNCYVPGRVPSATGDPEAYLEHAIEEALNNKRESNRLRDHHPNLLAVNYLLDQCFQMALSRQRDVGNAVPSPYFDGTFDAVLLAASGIDQIPSIHSIHLEVRTGLDHPLLSFWRQEVGRDIRRY